MPYLLLHRSMTMPAVSPSTFATKPPAKKPAELISALLLQSVIVSVEPSRTCPTKEAAPLFVSVVATKPLSTDKPENFAFPTTLNRAAFSAAWEMVRWLMEVLAVRVPVPANVPVKGRCP